MGIRLGTWCPECSTGLGERICRIFFEAIFNNKFPKYRPKWLINRDKNQMELDGYCRKLSLAFEHQGQQHSRRIKYFHTEEDFVKRKSDDDEKDKLCKEHGITLICIPEIPSLLPISEVQEYILNKCIESGINNFPNDINSIRIDLKKAYLADSNNQFEQIKAIAKDKGGHCLSNQYLGSNTKLIFKCENDHIFELRPRHVKIGIWCPKCSREKSAALRKSTLDEMKLLADSHDGKCLSKNYTNIQTKLKWQCKFGHVWESKPNNIQQGKWCPVCGRENSNNKKKLSIDEMKTIAEERGGKCLSNLYVNSGTKLLWQCKEGHLWEATPSNVKSGNWCPFCAKSNKYPKNQLVLI